MLADAIAISFWPFSGLMAFIYIKMKSSQTRIAFAVVVGLWIYLPLLFLFAISGFASMAIVFDVHLGLIVVGFYFLWMLMWAVRDFSENRKKVNNYILGLLVLGLVAFVPLGLGIWYLGGDYLLPRTLIGGPIQNLRIEHHGSGRYRMPDEFIVEIDDNAYKATKRMFATLHPGQRIRAEVGKGSGYIFNISR